MDDVKEDLQNFCIEIIKNKDDELLGSITNLMDFVKDNLSKNDKIIKILEASPRMFFHLDKKQQANIENIKVALENFTTIGHDFLDLIPKEYFKDKDLVESFAYKTDKVYSFMDVSLYANKQLCSSALRYFERTDIDIKEKIPIDMLNDKEFIIEHILENTNLIKPYVEDMQFVIKCMKKNNNVYMHLSNDFKKDPQIISLLQNSYLSFRLEEHIPDDVKDNKELMLEFIDKHINISNILSERLKDDMDIAKKYLSKPSLYANFFSKRLRDNDEFAYLAIAATANNLSCLSDRLKNDENLVRFCFKKHRLSDTYVHMGQTLKNIPEFIDYFITYFNGYISICDKIPAENLENKELLLKILKKRPKEFVFEYFPKHFRENRTFVMDALMQEIDLLEHLKEARVDYIEDKELILLAIKNYSKTKYSNPIGYLHENLRNDEEIIKLINDNFITKINWKK